MVGQQSQGDESEGRGEDQLSAVAHDSPVHLFSGTNRGDGRAGRTLATLTGLGCDPLDGIV
jgi:hypothetical protein